MTTISNMSRLLSTNRRLEKPEPYEGKLSRMVLRGERSSNAPDLPDRPSNLSQRDGRAVRKGNEIAKLYADNKVDVVIYAVEKSLDSYKFNLLHCKQTFISQLKSGAMGARAIDEGSMDEKSGMNFSEYMAVLSGNTDLLDKARLGKKVAALESERKSFYKDKSGATWKLESYTKTLEGNNEHISKMTADYTVFTSRAQTDEDGYYRFFIEGAYKYTYNNGQLAMSDHKAAATNFLNALDRIPKLIEQYQTENAKLEKDLPTLRQIVGGTWNKEEELKELKSEVAALERKKKRSPRKTKTKPDKFAPAKRSNQTP